MDTVGTFTGVNLPHVQQQTPLSVSSHYLLIQKRKMVILLSIKQQRYEQVV